MKRTIFIVTTFAFVFLLTNCAKEDLEDTTLRNNIILTRAETEVVEAGNTFSFDLLGNLVDYSKDEDLIFSPLSAYASMNILLNGAKGDTYGQIVKAIGSESIEIGTINSTFKALTSGLDKADKSSTILLSNSLWISRNFTIKDEFKSTLETDFDATVRNLDFNSPASVSIINKWASDKTKKMIPEVIKELSGDFIILNALYFKGKWTEKFDPSRTAKRSFHMLKGGHSQIDFMTNECKYLYYHDKEDGKEIIEMPYGNGAFVMDIVLPDEEKDFLQFIKGFNRESFDRMLSRLDSSGSITVTLPKFKINSQQTLTNPLAACGIVDAFYSGKADFGLMTSGGLSVDDISQCAVIEVDENGTEAASVTTVKGSGAIIPGHFVADHPFLFVIREISTGAILFMGINATGSGNLSTFAN